MPAPRAVDPGYTGIHHRLRADRGQASNFTCPCGSPASDWAYDGTDPNERTSERGTYSLDLDRYVALCRSCHWKQDRAGRCRKGHRLDEANAYRHKGVVRCRQCRREMMRMLRDRKR